MSANEDTNEKLRRITDQLTALMDTMQDWDGEEEPSPIAIKMGMLTLADSVRDLAETMYEDT